MATLVKFEDFALQLGKKEHDLSADTLKVFLSSTAPVKATMGALADVTGIIVNTNIGAAWPTITKQYTEASGVGTLAADALVITASGAVPTFRYYGIYNDTTTTPDDALICYWDHGSDVTLASGETFTITFGADATMGTILTVE